MKVLRLEVRSVPQVEEEDHEVLVAVLEDGTERVVQWLATPQVLQAVKGNR